MKKQTKLYMHLYKGVDGETRFRIKHRNGHKLVWSEGYSNVTMAERTLTRMIDAIKKDQYKIVRLK